MKLQNPHSHRTLVSALSSFLASNSNSTLAFIRLLTLLLISTTAAFSAPALAADSAPPVSMGAIVAKGNGCPEGTVSSALSPDKTALSILFDQFKAAAGDGSAAPHQAKATCSIRVPLSIPAKYQVQLVKVDIRGFNNLGDHSASRVSTTLGYDFNWHGWSIPFYRSEQHETFRGPLTDEFELTSSIKGPHWSPCGQSITLVINSKIQDVSTTGSIAETEIDSLDAVTAPFSMNLKWRKCR